MNSDKKLSDLSKRFITAMGLSNISGYKLKQDGIIKSESTLTKIKNGIQQPSRKTIDMFCEKYGINKAWIYTGEGLYAGVQDDISGDEIVDAIENANLQEVIANEKSPKKNTHDIKSHFKYDYTVKDFFKDYYSYLNHREIEESLLEKQLSDLPEDDIAKIAGTMGLDYQDFMKGIEIVTESSHTGKLVPIYSANATAGKTGVETTNSREGWINVGDLLKDSEGSLYVYGNSMIPGYPPGSLLGICHLNESFIEPGSVYVVQTESNRYIKRLYYNNDRTAFVCLSDNHIKHADGPMEGQYLYPPFEIPLSSVKIVFKVVGVIKRNSVSTM